MAVIYILVLGGIKPMLNLVIVNSKDHTPLRSFLLFIALLLVRFPSMACWLTYVPLSPVTFPIQSFLL